MSDREYGMPDLLNLHEFDEEALKAQALAAYSFIKSKNNAGIAPSLAMKSNVSSKVKSAVSAVSGEAIYYNGKIIEAVYSASQGGSSASSEQVWGGKVPYLVSVENDYDEYDRYYGYEKTFTESEVEDYLESYLGKSLSSDPEDWIVIENLTTWNPVYNMKWPELKWKTTM